MTAAAKPIRDQIVELQYLRALAVMLVVIGHTHQTEGRFFADPLLGEMAYFGFSGVDVFFVVSGFIIHHLYRGISGFDPAFLLNRLNRIFPLYWVFTAAALVGYALIGDQLTRAPGLADILTSIALIPTGQPPVLVVGWTLVHELYFYVCYGIFLMLPARLRGVAALVWAVMTIGFAIMPEKPGSPWLALAVSPFNLLFLVGALLAELKNMASRQRWAALALAVSGLLAGVFWADRLGLEAFTNPAARLLYFGPFALGLVWAVLAWKPRLPVLLQRVGDWSYAIYLGHVMWIGALVRVLALQSSLPPLAASLLVYGLALTGSVLLGWLSHRLIERPMLSYGKRGIRRLPVTRRA